MARDEWHLGDGVANDSTGAPGRTPVYVDLTSACGALWRRTQYFPSYSWDSYGFKKNKPKTKVHLERGKE